MITSNSNLINLGSYSPSASPMRRPVFHPSSPPPLPRKHEKSSWQRKTSEFSDWEGKRNKVGVKRRIDFFQQENIEPNNSNLSFREQIRESSNFFHPLTINSGDKEKSTVAKQIAMPTSHSKPILKFVSGKRILNSDKPSEFINSLIPVIKIVTEKIRAGEKHSQNKNLYVSLFQPFNSIRYFSSIADGLLGQMSRDKYYERLNNNLKKELEKPNDYLIIGSQVSETIQAYIKEISQYPGAIKAGKEKDLFLKSVENMNFELKKMHDEIKFSQEIKSINFE